MDAKGKPNVLVILADQHRHDCLGAYGNRDIKTPNIDTLAQDGVLYKNSFCPYPVCTPSRYSLITGLYTHQHLGWSNHCTLPAGLDTFPALLRKAGYKTSAVGKMHYTPAYLDAGFDEMRLAEQDGPGRFDDDYHRYLKERGLADDIDIVDQRQEYRCHAAQEYWDTFGAVESNLSEEHHSTTWIGDRSVEAIDRWEGGGNLLMAGFIKPHHPFDPPYPWSSRYDPEGLELLPGWLEHPIPRDVARARGYFANDTLTEKSLRKVMAYYYATISQIDYHVGRMINLLKEKQLYEDTLILYTSDHGDYMGFHHMLLKGNDMYDPLIKVPLIIKYPGRAKKNTATEAMTSTVDVAPTILSQCGCQPGKYMKGLDLAKDEKGRELVFAEQIMQDGHCYMVRSRTRKLLLCRDETKSRFFDLEKDPLEMNNLIDEPAYRDEIETYKKAAAEWVLFETPSPIHLDYGARLISGSNVPSAHDGHREEMENYFRQKVKIR